MKFQNSETGPPATGNARIKVTYRLRGNAGDAAALARNIAYEQTVELPEAQVPDDIRDRVVGRVEDIRPDPEL
ncbi:MAG TPA: hypothetical protein VGB36_01070, partial [Gammaproteobacteria bacterium]